MTRELVLQPSDNIRLVELCGPLDQHLHQIEATLGVEVKRRGNRFQLIGSPAAIKDAEAVLQGLYTRAQREPVDSERVHIALQELGMEGRANPGGGPDSGGSAAVTGSPSDELKVRTMRGAIRARGHNQTEYLNNVRGHDLTFGIGPPARERPIWRWPAPSKRCRRRAYAGSSWCARPSRRASGWGSSRGTCRRRSIRIFGRCTMPCTK